MKLPTYVTIGPFKVQLVCVPHELMYEVSEAQGAFVVKPPYKIYLDKGFVVRFSNLSPVSAQIKIETKWSWRSYGEDIIIDLENTDGMITTIKFLSSCSGIFQIFDWGKNTWGSQSGIDVVLTGVSSTSSVGTISPADVMGLTGLSATSSTGSLSIVSSPTFTLTGVSSTSSVGSVDIANMVVGLTGLSTTSSVGSIAPADVMGLTGVLSTSAVGEVTTSGAAVVNLTGVLSTSAVGAITPPGQTMGLTGVSSTTSTGSINPADVMGLTGVQATSSVNAAGISFPGTYERLGPKTSTGYANRAPKTSTGYTRRNPA